MAEPALSPADGFEFRIGRPAAQHVPCHGLAGACIGLADQFEQRPGNQAGAVCEIGRSIRIVLQDVQNITRFERGTDAASDRLGAVGDERKDFQAELCGDFLKKGLQGDCRRLTADLGRRAHGNVDHDMGGPGGDLL